MQRAVWLPLVAILIFATGALAQTMSNTGTAVAPPTTAPVILSPLGGYVGGGYIVGTPTVSIGGNAAPSPAGASNATPGLEAGATNSTLLQGGLPAGSVTTQDAITYSPGAVVMPVNASGGAPSAAGAAPHPSAPGVFNTGAAQFGAEQGLQGKPLAQLAAEHRRQPNQNVRLYTNQDLQRLAQQPTTGFETNGVTGQGANAYMQGAGASPPTPAASGAVAAPANNGAIYQAPPAPEPQPQQAPPPNPR